MTGKVLIIYFVTGNNKKIIFEAGNIKESAINK